MKQISKNYRKNIPNFFNAFNDQTIKNIQSTFNHKKQIKLIQQPKIYNQTQSSNIKKHKKTISDGNTQLLRFKSMDKFNQKTTLNSYTNIQHKIEKMKISQVGSDQKVFILSNKCENYDQGDREHEKKNINIIKILENYEMKIQFLKVQNKQLRKQNKNFRKDIQKFDILFQQYEKTIKTIQIDIKRYKSELDNKNIQISYLRSVSESLIEKVDILNQNIELKKQIQRRRKQLDQIYQKFNLIVNQNQAQKKLIHQLQQIIFQLHCENTLYKNYIQKQQKDQLQFKDERYKIKQKLTKLRIIYT